MIHHRNIFLHKYKNKISDFTKINNEQKLENTEIEKTSEVTFKERSFDIHTKVTQPSDQGHSLITGMAQHLE